MTRAVCFQCGVIKFGAFCPCPECGDVPATKDDLALSLAMTDHYFDMATLDQIGASVRDGHPPQLDPQTHADLMQQIRSSKLVVALHDAKEGQSVEPSELAKDVHSPTHKPWWKFW